MARIPISVSKILQERKIFRGLNENKYSESFLIQIEEKNQKWDLSHIAHRKDLIKFRNELNDVLGFKEIAEKFNCSIEEAEKISDYQESEKICKNCPQKNLVCFDCIYTCQSPLEQKLYVALKNSNIDSELQRRIRKDGTGYSKEFQVDRKTILTLPDFYIETSDKKICIYADGHTYHERTEYQALRDRNIDRELQNLGFVCLRFTGKEIREKIENVIETIKKSMELKPVPNNV
ncbi:DUF559 domain-containing protein [Winogradskyella algicola]|uniref:DUF559 domain-containing protein n=1 Tax=Winogradskyella algicola TaxID=2575815 RepID=UPI001107F5AB|nr:DUF559 domain-containing protein [Winogradskyella algicola]